jgi:transposase InsO family protein
MSIKALLTQPEVGASEGLVGLGDTGSDCNFLKDEWAQSKGFVASTQCEQDFVTFSGDKFKVLRAYDLEAYVTDDRNETRPFKLRFYGCQGVGSHNLVFGMEFYEATISQYADYKKKRWAYAPAWGDAVKLLTFRELEAELDADPDLKPQVMFLSKGECDCPRQWSSCLCDGSKVTASIPRSDDPSLETLTYQVNTLRKGALEVPAYLREEGNDFSDVFDPDKASELPDLGGVEHSIETDGPVPYGPLYQLSETQLEALRAYLHDALQKRWIRPSTSPAGAPILFVPKKDGGLRLCVDYRGLNKVTIKNRHPLPLIDETLDRLVGARIFTKLDLKDAYHRVRIQEGHEWKTAFRTRYGHFEYLVMPFGLANAPATFQAYVNTAMAGLLDDFVVVYLDDILIYSKNEDEHHDHVRQVLTRLRKHNLYAKLSKCEFDVKEVEFLGFLVGINGVQADPERIRSVVEWPQPQSFHDVQVFLGFANFYRRFIHRYSAVTLGLTDLLKGMVRGRKAGELEWTKEAEASFQNLKTAFTQAPILIHFDPSKKVRVETDASGFAIAGTISQQQSTGEGTKMHWHPVAFWSRKLSPAERNYSTYDAELLAIVEAFKQWRHYLEGSRFTIEVITDHNNLRYFTEAKYLGGRQARWAMFLATYDFEIIYRKGTANPADGPSRRPDYEEGPADVTWLPTFQNKMKGAFAVAILGACQHLEESIPEPERIIFALSAVAQAKVLENEQKDHFQDPSQEKQGVGNRLEGPAKPAMALRVSTTSTPDGTKNSSDPRVFELDGCKHLIPRSWICAATERATALAPLSEPLLDLIQVAQRNDSRCQDILKNRLGKRDANGEDIWTFESGILKYHSRAVVPDDPALRQEVMKLHHDDPLAGHYGIEKTLELLRRSWYWENMEIDVRNYCKECDVCQRVKAKRHKPYGLLASLPQPKRPWGEISMDFITGLPGCKNPAGGPDFDAILVVVDRYSKMARYIACHKTVDSPELAKILWERVFSLFGTPDGIVSDRGTVFTSHFWSAFCFHLRCKQRLSTAFHPQTDGQTERQNQALEHYLRSYCNTQKNDWAKKLPFAEFAYNNSKHQVLQDTPFHVCYGYHPQLPWNPEDRIKGEVPAARRRLEVLQEERIKLQELWHRAQNNRELYYNKHRLSRHYAPGEWVMLSTKNIKLKAGKLAPKFIGPFKILECIGEAAYKLDLPNLYEKLHSTFHVSLLEKYASRRGQVPDLYPSGDLPELADDDEEQEWEVEAIVDHKTIGKSNQLRYLIKWKDWPEDHNTWLPAYPNLENARELLESYNKNHDLNQPTSGTPQKRIRNTKNTPRRRGRPRKEKRGPGRPRKVRNDD